MRFARVLCPALLIVWLTALPAHAENYSGTWTVEPSGSGQVHVSVQYTHNSPGDNEEWSESSDMPYSRLSGLSPSDFASNGEHKTFAIVRDAGTLRADGWFAHGRGNGSWTFEPSASFRSELARRGVGGVDDAAQFHLAMADFKISTLDALLAAGYQRPSAADLVRMTDHGVGEKFLQEMRGVPVSPRTIDELVRMRDHGVTGSFAAAMMRADPRLDGDSLIRLRDHGVTPAYMEALASSGYRNITPDEAEQMRDHGVSTDYIQGLQRLGYHPSVSDLVRLADHGVSIAFIERLRSHGYTKLRADDLIRLRDHGF